jgi:protein-S-isoprenylcysteine O-methyltransferase Ste14
VNERSRAYGMTQTLLLFSYAAVMLFARGPLLFDSILGRRTGIALCAAGLALLAAALVSLRKVVSAAPEPKAGGRLVTTGVYGRLRHPIYTAIILLVAGLFLRKPTPALAVVSAIVIAFIVMKTRFEEQLLEQRYPEYAEYRKRTIGVVPGLR